MTHEAYRARDHWDFWGAMDGAFDEYAIEFNQTPAFWELTRRAHQDSVILRLGRLYDPHQGATSLGNLLQTIRTNPPVVGAVISKAIAELDEAELDADVANVSDRNPTVEKLLLIRNEYLAHRGTRHITKGTFASLPTLDKGEISDLIMVAIELLRKYNDRLGYPPLAWGQEVVGEFHQLLLLLRAGLDSKAP